MGVVKAKTPAAFTWLPPAKNARDGQKKNLARPGVLRFSCWLAGFAIGWSSPDSFSGYFLVWSNQVNLNEWNNTWSPYSIGFLAADLAENLYNNNFKKRRNQRSNDEHWLPAGKILAFDFQWILDSRFLQLFSFQMKASTSLTMNEKHWSIFTESETVHSFQSCFPVLELG